MNEVKTKNEGKQFGPEPWQFDPYDGMSDDEVDELVDRIFERQKMMPISIRLPRALLDRAKAEGKRRGVPYQTLLRALIEAGLEHAHA